MKQVQITSLIKGTKDYGSVVLKGIATDTNYFVYDTRNPIQILTLTIKDFTTKSYKVEETHELTDKEVWILEEYVDYLTDYNYFKRRKDEFEAEILGLANNNEQLAVIDLLASFETYANCKDEYEYTLKRVVELNNKLEEIEKGLIHYLNELADTDSKEVNFIELINSKTGTYLDGTQLNLTIEGHAPLKELSNVLAFNSVMFNTDGLLKLELITEGMIDDLNFRVEVTYPIVEPLTRSLTNELIEEFKEAAKFLKTLNNGHKKR
jgi:hypothetical protein